MRLGTYYRKELLKNLNVKTNTNDVVLDVWCFDWYWLSTQVAQEKHAIDLDIDPIYDGINYQKWDATNLPYENEYFDKVFAFDVIEHVNLWTEKKFVEELLRVTKKWGEVLFTTPSKDIRLFPHFLTNWISKKWGHYKCNWYTKDELRTFIPKEYNIELAELDCRGYLVNYLILRLIWKINKKFVMFIIDKIAIKDSKKTGINGYIMTKIYK